MLNLDKEKEGEGPLLIEDMGKILSSLASEDALKILHEARSGITNSSEAIRKLGLTQKRYYTRLKPLIEVGLIEKTGEGYKLTFLGKILYEIIYRKLEKTLESKDRIALIDKLNKAESLSREEKEQIASAISTKERTIGYSDIFGGMKPVKIMRSFDELISEIANSAKEANESVFLASKYLDSRVFDPLIRAWQRGAKLYVLDGEKSNLLSKMQMLRVIFSNPKEIKQLIEIVSSSEVKIRHVNLEYSFIVIDRKNCALEIVDPASGKFLFGLVLSNEEISSKLIQAFNDLYEKSQSDPLIKLIQENSRDN